MPSARQLAAAVKEMFFLVVGFIVHNFIEFFNVKDNSGDNEAQNKGA
jgi:hypothetical protein